VEWILAYWWVWALLAFGIWSAVNGLAKSWRARALSELAQSYLEAGRSPPDALLERIVAASMTDDDVLSGVASSDRGDDLRGFGAFFTALFAAAAAGLWGAVAFGLFGEGARPAVDLVVLMLAATALACLIGTVIARIHRRRWLQRSAEGETTPPSGLNTAGFGATCVIFFAGLAGVFGYGAYSQWFAPHEGALGVVAVLCAAMALASLAGSVFAAPPLPDAAQPASAGQSAGARSSAEPA
jgi:hypothetical protein